MQVEIKAQDSLLEEMSFLDVLFEDGNDQMLRDAVAYLKDKICTPKHIYKMTEKEFWITMRLYSCVERRIMPDDAREAFLSSGDAYAGVFH